LSRPRLLDLCCGAGGAAMGYYRAGFEVVGVDIEPQPRYPFSFIQDDALTFPLSGFTVIHASPPCKKYSQATSFHPGVGEQHVSLIEPLRERLQASGLPYIIENVERAPLHNPIKLCGAMFGLRVYRHRLFESNMLLLQPSHIKHRVKAAPPGAIAKEDEYWCVGGHFGRKEEAQAAMGIGWMQAVNEIAQAIPPAYTEWIGRQALSFVV
jgi:DNA (cytosine-5)-methyltransferase 1